MIWPPFVRGARIILVVAAQACGGARAGDDVIVAANDGPPGDAAARIGIVAARPWIHGGRPADYDLGEMFDRHVFGVTVVRSAAGGFVPAASGGRSGVLARLGPLREHGARRIAALERICGLSEGQREILALALESDLRRLAGGIEQVRRRYVGERLPITPQEVDRERLQALRADADDCRRRIEGLWRSGSLLVAVAGGTLSSAQRSAWEEWLAGRRAARWEAMVRTVLGQFDESTLGLSERQHAALVGQLLAEVPPLAVFDDEPGGPIDTRLMNVRTLLVVGRLGSLDREPLRRLFDPRQWAAVEQMLGREETRATVVRQLIEQGVLEEE